MTLATVVGRRPSQGGDFPRRDARRRSAGSTGAGRTGEPVGRPPERRDGFPAVGVLAGLAERIRSIETTETDRPDRPDHLDRAQECFDRERRQADAQRVSLGWGDEILEGGLLRGRLHEWFGLAGFGRRWAPPLCVLAHIAGRAVGPASDPSPSGVAVFVGRNVWPYPHLLAHHVSLERALFIDPPDDETRWWTMDVALRSPAVSVVIGDGRGLPMAESRRLQLAANAGRTLGLLARPPAERGVLSAAATRWNVTSVADGRRPAWSVDLCRLKGGWLGGDAAAAAQERDAGDTDRHRLDRTVSGASPRTWRLEWDHAQGVIDTSSKMVRGSRTSVSSAHARTHAQDDTISTRRHIA